MTPILPIELFVLFTVGVLVLGFVAAPRVLLYLSLPVLMMLQGQWKIAGVLVDPSDLMFAGIGICLITRPTLRRPLLRARIPYLTLWLALVAFAATAYLSAPINSQYLTDPIRIVYQVYRYAWKPSLYYLLTAALLSDRRKLQVALVMVIISADLVSVEAIPQGYGGLRATGPFDSPNELGGAIVAPLILCVSGLLSRPTGWRRVFYLISVMLIGRTLTFSGSRGAFLATVGGIAVLIGVLLVKGHYRTRIARLVAAGLLVSSLALVVKPDLFDRPTVQRLLSVRRGTEEENLKWRMEERWPHFLMIVEKNPWFGVGTNVDDSLGGATCNTPHNGYIAIAVKSGVPVLLLFAGFGFLGVTNAVRLAQTAKDSVRGIFGATIAAALVGILIHNVVDVTFDHGFVGKLFWMLVAMGSVTARRPAMLLAKSQVSKMDAGTNLKTPPELATLGAHL